MSAAVIVIAAGAGYGTPMYLVTPPQPKILAGDGTHGPRGMLWVN